MYWPATGEPLASEQDRAKLFPGQPAGSSSESNRGQFMEAWYWARMSHLFCWWQPLSVESARIAPAPAPRKVQQEATALIQAGDNFAALATQVLSVDITQALRSLSCGCKITWNDPAFTPMVGRLQA